MVAESEIAAAGDLALRHLLGRAASTGLLMRHCAILIVAIINVATPAPHALPAGKWLIGATAVWSLYRLSTRSARSVLVGVDYLLVLGVCAAIPLAVSAPDFYVNNSAPVAIAGTAVVSFSLMLGARISLAMTVAVALAYAWGTAQVIGWQQLPAVTALYYFFLQWGSATLIRALVARVATTVDRIRAQRIAAELEQDIHDAVHRFRREQVSLLHDTAASTLMMVATAPALPPERLSAQARRDLRVLAEGPWIAPPPRAEVVAALRDNADYLRTPVRFAGVPELWLDGESAAAVVAAAREAMTNVDRHANASTLVITATPDRVVLADDGVGFRIGERPGRHGVAESVIGRMRRADGTARVYSAPGEGTTVELRWGDRGDDAAVDEQMRDPEHLAERAQMMFSFLIMVVALAVLSASIGYSLTQTHRPAVQLALAGTGIAGMATAIPGILRGRWALAWPGAIAVFVVAVGQPLSLTAAEIGGEAHWAWGAAGWLLLPLLLGIPTRQGAAILLASWLAAAAVSLIKAPAVMTVIGIGLGTASLFGVQLFALLYAALIRDAAADVATEAAAHRGAVTNQQVSKALRDDFDSRYAAHVEAVIPLLTALSAGDPVDDDLRRQARSESHRMRALFNETAAFDYPLMRHLRTVVDTAGDDGANVTVQLEGELPPVDDKAICRLAEPLVHGLRAQPAAVRVVITGEPDNVTVSVVCEDVSDLDRLRTGAAHLGIDLVSVARTVWMIERAHAPNGDSAMLAAP